MCEGPKSMTEPTTSPTSPTRHRGRRPYSDSDFDLQAHQAESEPFLSNLTTDESAKTVEDEPEQAPGQSVVQEEDNTSNDSHTANKETSKESEPWLNKSSLKTIFIGLGLLVVTAYSFPYKALLDPEGNEVKVNSLQNVWWCAWVTCISTGLGALPFLVFREFDRFWLGVCNAFAAGMMIGASICLLAEAIMEPSEVSALFPAPVRAFLGVVLGVGFILLTKRFLDEHEDVHLESLDGLNARRALLIMSVMTLHSFTEGVGVGVSFGGDNGSKLGTLISATMAVHNVPEGLAVALVLIPKGISISHAAYWAVFSSIPQPLMAVPAFMFVDNFLPLLPVGLGFAAGAMGYVAIFELGMEALEDAPKSVVSFTAMAASLSMVAVQVVLKLFV